MARAQRSGRKVTSADLPIILGMVKREDRRHDIAAWLGLNQGRIAEVEEGKHGQASPAPVSALPPSGSPGPKALELRADADEVYKLLKKGDVSAALKVLEKALIAFDKNK